MSTNPQFDPAHPTLAQAIAYNRRFGGSRVVAFGPVSVLLPLEALRGAVAELQAGIDEVRQLYVAGVEEALRTGLPAMQSGEADEETTRRFMQFVVIWFANEVCDGRASLELH